MAGLSIPLVHIADDPVPSADDRNEIHRVIYDELCQSVTTAKSEAEFVTVAKRLGDQGADCLILGCTEVGLLLNSAMFLFRYLIPR